MRLRVSLTLVLLAACAKLPTKEKSTTPPDTEPSVTVQPDPEPYEGGTPFDGLDGASPPPSDAGCPDAWPEAGADCAEWAFARDCDYVTDGGGLRCTCYAIPEGTWWSCGSGG